MRGGLSLIWQRLVMDKDAHTHTHTLEKWTKWRVCHFGVASPPHPSWSFSLPECSAQGNRICTVQEKLYLCKKPRQARGGISSATQTGEGLADHVTSPSHTPTLYPNAKKKNINLQPTYQLHCMNYTVRELVWLRFCAPQSSPLEKNPSQTNSGLHQGFPQTSAHSSALFYPMCHSFACRHSPTDTYSSVIITTFL